MAISLLTLSVHSTLAQTIQNEIISRSSKYYFAIGRNYAWGTANDVPLDTLDTVAEEIQTRKDFIRFTEIGPNDVAIVIERYNWEGGLIYDQYEEYSSTNISANGATSLDTSTFYVLTDEYNVYKCLYNNGNSASTVKPTGTSVDAFTNEEDGYTWKFMYTIPPFLRNKFLTATQMPVTTALSTQFYTNGSLSNIVIEAKGSGYSTNNILTGTVYSDLNGDTAYSSISSVSRTDNIVTITTSAAHSFVVNDKIYLEGITNVTASSLNGTYTIKTVTSNTFTFYKAGTNISSTAITAGKAYILNLKKLYGSTSGTSTVFTSQLSAGSIIQIASEQYTVVSIESNSVLTLDRHAYVASPSEFKLIRTKLEINGDGQRIDNPLRLSSISITNTGENYINPVVSFSQPTLEGGRVARGHATLGGPDGGLITGIIIDDPGFGYASTPLVSISDVNVTDSADFAYAYCITQKNPAFIEPIINSLTGEINNIAIVANGEGYTTASINVYSLGINGTVNTIGSGASIVPNTNVGELDTKQANQELLAKNGAIHVIKVTNGGSGYTVATVALSGDGSGCTATPILEDGVVTKIIVNSIGSKYTQLNVTIVGDGSGATAKAIISPLGGHGKNAINELYGRTILFYGRVTKDAIKSVTINDGYRQVALMKKLKKYSDNLSFNTFSGTTCYKITGLTDVPSAFAVGNILHISSGTNKYRYRLVAKTQYSVLLTAIDNVSNPSIGQSLLKLSDPNNSSSAVLYTYGISEVVLPDIDRFSGDIIYRDNRAAFIPTTDQFITISSRFRL